MGATTEDATEHSWSATRAWVEKTLSAGERIERVDRLRGGWTSAMRGLHITGPDGTRSLVLRSFVTPFFVRHAEGLLTREADILRLLTATDVPAATLVAVDATARHCDHPSLLMTRLPGAVHLHDEGAGIRADELARLLVRVHRLRVPAPRRPRPYQAWASPDHVTTPATTRRPELWRRAADVVRREPPPYEGRFLHRDFHPGNVLFTGPDDAPRVSGVVDWVETSWGPADLDVAHCATALALLHGAPAGMDFADRYTTAGGSLTPDPRAHLYWRCLDTLGYGDAEKVAVPWRALGRTDLTPEVLTSRLEDYLDALFTRYG
ncbi:phosphotransferase family protein [Streptomyces sp. SudanB66_2053]|uniref:phosphotransferase family protein n=1 Tax=Streptomyces TaxID=1883 RepID=UPI003F56297E